MNYQEIRANNKRIYAFDFDGTLTTNPGASSQMIPNPTIIEHAKKLYNEGHCIIIWTCRNGEPYIGDMKKFLKKHDVGYHYINENVEGLPFNTSSKIFYDILYDDRAGNVHDLFKMLTQINFTHGDKNQSEKIKKVLS